MQGIGKLVAMVLAAGLVGCSGAPEASLSPEPTAASAVASPSVGPGATPTAASSVPPTGAPIDPPSAAPETPSGTPPGTPPVAPSPTISATPDAPSPTWNRVGRIGNGEISIMSVVGFAGGFVAVGDRGLEGGTFAFSADGREWQVGSLSETIQDCAGNPTNDAFVSGAASDGQRILVLGKRLGYTTEICSDPDQGVGAGAITWQSTDGQTWTRSSDFAHVHAIASHAWPIPGGGWEVSVSSWDRPSAIWQSADGLSWHETASFPEQVGSSIHGTADAAGMRLLEVQPDEEPLRLVTSSDGVNWSALNAQPAVSKFSYVKGMLSPAGAGMPWIIVSAEDLVGSAIWTSADLGAWTKHAFPGRRIVTNIVAISDGYLATAERFGFYEIACDGGRCPGPAERQYFSSDGISWTEIPLRLRAGAFFAESPAGVIAVGRFNGSVWLLER
jgi:hypothetical protein